MSSAPVPAQAPPDIEPPPEPPPIFQPSLNDGALAHHPHAFWQQPHVINILSLATSLAFHLGLLLLGFIGFRTYQNITDKQAVPQVIIPDAAIVENAPIGGIPNPGLGADPERAAAQDQVKDVMSSADSFSQQKGAESLTQSLMGGSGAEADKDSVIAPGVRPGFGSGNNNGSGEGDGGRQLPFGPTGGGGGTGPKTNFVGLSGNARTVAYVCDRSGSMLNLMVALKSELRKSVDILRPTQGFNIIFFSEPGKAEALSKEGLIMATPDNKRKAFTMLNGVFPAGSTDPIPGLEIAFKTQPNLIYLLTDGDFPDNEAVRARIRALNGKKTTKINTILFTKVDGDVSKDPGKKEIIKLLKQIAEENEGRFKVVDPSNL